MDRARRIALTLGLALLGAFITVMTVHYLLPFDPFNTDASINFHLLFVIVFVVIFGIATIAHNSGRHSS